LCGRDEKADCCDKASAVGDEGRRHSDFALLSHSHRKATVGKTDLFGATWQFFLLPPRSESIVFVVGQATDALVLPA